MADDFRFVAVRDFCRRAVALPTDRGGACAHDVGGKADRENRNASVVPKRLFIP